MPDTNSRNPSQYMRIDGLNATTPVLEETLGHVDNGIPAVGYHSTPVSIYMDKPSERDGALYARLEKLEALYKKMASLYEDILDIELETLTDDNSKPS